MKPTTLTYALGLLALFDGAFASALPKDKDSTPFWVPISTTSLATFSDYTNFHKNAPQTLKLACVIPFMANLFVIRTMFVLLDKRGAGKYLKRAMKELTG